MASRGVSLFVFLFQEKVVSRLVVARVPQKPLRVKKRIAC